ncbi:hypothetical protein JXB41_04460 [Candidatus Woesearchaeota archaeon]|nr:hypothetical protein [Candidatus Woesearchaeota archaeon]
MKKKAMIEVQFNWLFILIAGSLILIFFIGMTRALLKGSRESLNLDIKTYLGEILTGIEVSSQTEHSIKLPDTELIVDCHELSIKGSELEGNSLQNKIVFSPDALKQEITTYTLYWEAPFKNSYFLFLSSPRIKYVIEKDTDYYFGLYDISGKGELPNNLNIEDPREYDEMWDFENSNYDKIKFIFFGEHPDLTSRQFTDLRRINNRDVSAIRITPDSSLPPDKFPDGYGKIEFYYYDGKNFVSEGSTYYLNKASLLGSVFAQDMEMYECNMQKALQRLEFVAEILSQRAENLNKPEVCDDHIFYNDAETYLSEIKTIAENRDLQELEIIYEKGYGKDLFSSSGPHDCLDDYNKLLQRQSCPSIY